MHLTWTWNSTHPKLTWWSVQFSCSVVSDSLRPHESQHTRPPCPSPTPGVYSKSCPSRRWCHPAISSSVVPFSSCPQSLPASAFPLSKLFTWGGQSIGVSASTSVLPVNTQGWSPLGWTGWISLQSKGLSRVFSNTTVQKHQFFSAQLSSPSNSHIHNDYWKNHSLDYNSPQICFFVYDTDIFDFFLSLTSLPTIISDSSCCILFLPGVPSSILAPFSPFSILSSSVFPSPVS